MNYQDFMQGVQRGIPYQQEPVPFFMAYPYAMQMQQGNEDTQDFERIKEMFPSRARKIQPLVEEECNRMEYNGSLMFDEFPDRLMMETVIGRIYDKLPSETTEQEEDVFVTECAMCNRSSENTVRDLIAVLLFQEMHRRRCRNRRCRRWW